MAGSGDRRHGNRGRSAAARTGGLSAGGRLAALPLLLMLAGCGSLPDRPPSGERGWAGVEHRVASEIERAGLPGASFAVARPGRAAHAAGFGVADLDSGEPLRPEARMRIASVSKPITAIAVLTLAGQGRVDLDAPVAARLAASLPGDVVVDPGLAGLTARHLLAHCGGWDSARDFDPMLQSRLMARLLGTQQPPSAAQIVAWALSRPPDFPPGARCAYSNLGYAMLGRLVEAETGLDYADAVRRLVLAPAGVEGMRPAATLPAARLPEEPRYHDPRSAPSVFDPEVDVPLADGAFAIEAMDAHGGWLASAQELVRLVAALEGWQRPALLPAPMRREMLAPVDPGDRRGEGYALGWDVARGGRHYWHQGDLPGTAALLVREADGSAWALIANGTLEDPRVHDRLRRRIGAAVRGWAGE